MARTKVTKVVLHTAGVREILKDNKVSQEILQRWGQPIASQIPGAVASIYDGDASRNKIRITREGESFIELLISEANSGALISGLQSVGKIKPRNAKTRLEARARKRRRRKK